MGDVHEITYISTSPPAKKIRESTVDNFDIDIEDIDVEEEKVAYLSLKLGDMNIENTEKATYRMPVKLIITSKRTNLDKLKE